MADATPGWAAEDVHPRGLPGPPRLRHPRADQSLVDAGLTLQGIGSGFFVTAEGDLVTNHHVVSGCTAFSVEAAKGQVALASLVASEGSIDLALLKTGLKAASPATFLTAIALDSRPVVVIGYPVLGIIRDRPLLVEGRLSGPWIGGARAFAFAVELHPGNSGGPVLDRTGAALGVVFARNEPTTIAPPSGHKVAKFGFAIAAQTVLDFLARHAVQPLHVLGSRASRAEASDDDILARANGYLVRVLCWRPRNAPPRTPHHPGSPR